MFREMEGSRSRKCRCKSALMAARRSSIPTSLWYSQRHLAAATQPPGISARSRFGEWCARRSRALRQVAQTQAATIAQFARSQRSALRAFAAKRSAAPKEPREGRSMLDRAVARLFSFYSCAEYRENLMPTAVRIKGGV